MRHLIRATSQAIINENWYCAIALALTLPDICGKLQHPNSKSGARYAAWWERYVMRKYQRSLGASEALVPLISGGDAYAIRCAFLHEGTDDVSAQNARKVLDRLYFLTPPRGFTIHLNGTAELQVQTNIFCDDICIGAEQWCDEHEADRDVQARMSKMLRIYDITGGVLA